MSTRHMKHSISKYLLVGICLFSWCVVFIGCSRYSKYNTSSKKRIDIINTSKYYRSKTIDKPKIKENIAEKAYEKQEKTKNIHKQKNIKKIHKKLKGKKLAPGLKESKKSKKIPKKRREILRKKLAKLVVPKEDREYINQENKLKIIQKEIEESGYILNQENSPKILKRFPLKSYKGFRITFQAKEGKYLSSLEEMVEKNLEERFAKNFRRIYRGKMSKIQEGVYVVDFIPQEYLQTYKKNELNSQ